MTTPDPGGPADSRHQPVDPAPLPKRPVPLVLSCGAGALGLVLLVGGLALGNTGLSVAGVVGGALSLGAALYWRSLLISEWSGRKRAPTRR